jgi:hypothetical protein
MPFNIPLMQLPNPDHLRQMFERQGQQIDRGNAIQDFNLIGQLPQPEQALPEGQAGPPMPLPKRTVNILGAVNAPGVILFPQETGLTLLDAIARAGGFNRFADKKRLKLTRVTSDGKPENFTINAEDILQGTAKENWVLIKDDVISVPERVL